MQRRRNRTHRRAYRNYYVPPEPHEAVMPQLPGRRRRPPTRRRHARRKRLIRRALRGIAAALAAMVMFISISNIWSYVSDYIFSRHASDALREAYYDEENIPQSALLEETVTIEEETTPLAPTPEAMTPPPVESVPVHTAAPQAVSSVLEEKRYPSNPDARVRDKFVKLRRQNKDIVGWLTIDGMLDEAVVKRDNVYYLNRDYRGYHNVNGAIFLDEACDLDTRPYTLMLFGHNMKTGLMFGRLRDYENIHFYREHPFITFDTAYENGRYVVFAAATIGLEPGERNYLDLNGLLGGRIERRRSAIAQLKALSVHTAMIEVEPEDQILLLVTCVDDDMERRVVAARRVRVGESEEQLARWVRQVDKK